MITVMPKLIVVSAVARYYLTRKESRWFDKQRRFYPGTPEFHVFVCRNSRKLRRLANSTGAGRMCSLHYFDKVRLQHETATNVGHSKRIFKSF